MMIGNITGIIGDQNHKIFSISKAKIIKKFSSIKSSLYQKVSEKIKNL
jgi:hypothetical protein